MILGASGFQCRPGVLMLFWPCWAVPGLLAAARSYTSCALQVLLENEPMDQLCSAVRYYLVSLTRDSTQQLVLPVHSQDMILMALTLVGRHPPILIGRASILSWLRLLHRLEEAPELSIEYWILSQHGGIRTILWPGPALWKRRSLPRTSSTNTMDNMLQIFLVSHPISSSSEKVQNILEIDILRNTVLNGSVPHAARNLVSSGYSSTSSPHSLHCQGKALKWPSSAPRALSDRIWALTIIMRLAAAGCQWE